LYHKHEEDKKRGINITRAISLTTSYDPGYQAVWLALKYFWRDMRKTYPKVQYWGVVEYNQNHTQPHFHFILDKDEYIKDGFDYIQNLWQKAQQQAHFKEIAWNVSIGQVRGDIEKYFTKYLTKLVGGKDEIPRPENWQGRYVRYSKKFFGAGISTKDILQALILKRNLDNEHFFSRAYFEIFPKWGVHSSMGQGLFIEASTRQEDRAKVADIRSLEWVDKGGVMEIEEDEITPQLDFLHISTFYGFKDRREKLTEIPYSLRK